MGYWTQYPYLNSVRRTKDFWKERSGYLEAQDRAIAYVSKYTLTAGQFWSFVVVDEFRLCMMHVSLYIYQSRTTVPAEASTDTSVIEAKSYKRVSINQIGAIKCGAEYLTTDHPPLEMSQNFTTEFLTAQAPSERDA